MLELKVRVLVDKVHLCIKDLKMFFLNLFKLETD